MNRKSLTLLFAMTLMTLMSMAMLLVPNAKAPLPPTVDTDEAIYAYWNVGGNVTIFGSGYDPSMTYGVWITYPGVWPQLFSTFTVVTDFEYIHPIMSPYLAGTYLVEIREWVSGPVVASCHFGVWGIDSSIYNRGESITVSGGGVDTFSTVAVDIYYDDDGELATTGDQTQMDVPAYWGVITDPIADGFGEFIKLVDVPDDAWVSDGIDAIYFVEITYNSYDGLGTTETGLTDTQTFEVSATYTITWTIPAAAVIRNRGHTQDFDFSVADASGDPVSGLTFLYLDMDGDLTTTEDQYGVPITEGAAGAYTGSWVVPSDAPTGAYDCIVVKSGNRGETADYVTVSDLIIVDLAVGAGTYGGLETIYFDAVIDYEDGADFTDMDGTAIADIWIDVDDDGEIDAGEFVADTGVPLLYDSGSDIWYQYYDLYPPGVIGGTYKIRVHAFDINDNYGTDSVTFDVVAQTMKDPTHGPVGTEVEIWGSGFAPDMPVTVTFYMSIADDVIGAGDGMRTDFTLIMMPVWIVEGSETIYLDGMETTDYTIDYATGVITFSTPPDFGVVISADYDYRIYLAWTSTNEYGSFSATFTVPESYFGPHGVDAFQEGIDPVRDIFEVEPQIVLSSTKGPPEGWITVTGTGFAPNSEVYIDGILPGYPELEGFEWTWALAETDPLGTFSEAIALPVLYLQEMYLDEGISMAPIGIYAEDDWENWDFTFYIATLFCEPSTIDVQVQVGALYFPGEIITAYASTSVDGAPTDVENIEFLAYYETAGPTPMTQWMPVIHIDTGLYAITTTLSPDEMPGNYLIEVKASKITHYGWDWFEEWWGAWIMWFGSMDAPEYWLDEWEEIYDEFMQWNGIDVTINGCGIDGFIISPTLMGMNAMLIGIEGDIATINTNIGLIQLDLAAINAKLSSIQGSIATIETDIGTIQTDISTINGAISSIQGNIATITSDLGTITTDIADINAHLASIDVSIVTITTDIGTIETTLSSINGRLTTIEGDVATIMTDVGAIELKLDDTVIPFLEAVEAKLDFINATTIRIETAIGDLELTVGEGVLIYLEAIEAKLDTIWPGVVRIESAIGDIELKLDETVIPFLNAIEAKLDFINATTLRIESAIGDIEVKLEDIGDFLDDIKAEIVDIDEKIATIETDIGTIKVDLTDINTKITVTNDNIAIIETDIGTIEGRLTSVEGDVATIETDIGTIKTTTDSIQTTGESIKTDTSLQPATVALSLIAAISAIAAAVMVLRKVYVK